MSIILIDLCCLTIYINYPVTVRSCTSGLVNCLLTVFFYKYSPSHQNASLTRVNSLAETFQVRLQGSQTWMKMWLCNICFDHKRLTSQIQKKQIDPGGRLYDPIYWCVFFLKCLVIAHRGSLLSSSSNRNRRHSARKRSSGSNRNRKHSARQSSSGTDISNDSLSLLAPATGQLLARFLVLLVSLQQSQV